VVTYRKLTSDDEIFNENVYTSDTSDEILNNILDSFSSTNESIVTP